MGTHTRIKPHRRLGARTRVHALHHVISPAQLNLTDEPSTLLAFIISTRLGDLSLDVAAEDAVLLQ